jgi:hypothetical protein
VTDHLPSPTDRQSAGETLRRTVEAIERGEIEGDAFARGYLTGVADTLDPPNTTRPPEESPAP